MKLLLVGTPDLAIPTFQTLSDCDHELVGVLTREPARTGRGRKLVSSPVATWGREAGLPVIETNELRTPAVQARVVATGADLAVVVAYGVLVPIELLQGLPLGWINLHFSDLPRWRGASPVQRALQAGDSCTAVTVFQLEAGLDTGPIWRRQPVPIDPHINAGELLSQLADLGASVTLSAVEAIARGEESPRPQPKEGVTMAPRLGRDESHVDFTAAANVVHNFIRSRAPHPGAFAWLGELRLKILAARVVESVALGAENLTALKPGQLATTRAGLFVGCGSGVLELVTVAPVGKAHMSGAAWARGARLDAQTTLS